MLQQRHRRQRPLGWIPPSSGYGPAIGKGWGQVTVEVKRPAEDWAKTPDSQQASQYLQIAAAGRPGR